MTNFNIKLPTDRFTQPVFDEFKRKNFIFGKNGTGKTTITHCIEQECVEKGIDVRIFSGYESVISSDGKLNTITLGRENTALQTSINKQKNKVNDLDKQINGDVGENDIKHLCDRAKLDLEHKEKSLDKFYRESAKKIKNKYLSLTGANYNKNDFISDLKASPMLLSSLEIDKYSREASEKLLENVSSSVSVLSLTENLDKCVKKVNSLLITEVIETKNLGFTEKQRTWVKEGMSLHKLDESTKSSRCLFCGGIISQKRIDDLNNYFNDRLNSLYRNIDAVSETIKRNKASIKNITLLNKEMYYHDFYQKVMSVNELLLNLKEKLLGVYENLLRLLDDKKKSPFTQIEPYNRDYTIDISIDKKIKELNNANNTYSKNINLKQNKAKNLLKLNDVAILAKEANWNQSYSEFKVLNTVFEQYDKKLTSLKEERDMENGKLQQLLEKTKDESIAASHINKSLSRLGDQSFSLIKIGDQKGQYQIKNTTDGKIRDVRTLSTGEKNIVAFLWFLNDLNNTSKLSTEKVIVFDDPMNSNDDTTQYLIISELQKLLKTDKDNTFFILTHNIHFYLNVRYRTWWNGCKSKNYDKATFFLHKTNGVTYIEYIRSENQDLTNTYQSLWSELKWMYENEKPDYMLNPIRRILETYKDFNGLTNKQLYLDDAEVEKLLNVNSHGIDDNYSNPNGKSAEQLIDILRKVFEGLGAIDHFNCYWNNSID